jgi:hypothetical protein
MEAKKGVVPVLGEHSPRTVNTLRCGFPLAKPSHWNIFNSVCSAKLPSIGIGNASQLLFTHKGREQDPGERKARTI